MEELVKAAGDLLTQVAPRQTRYKVTDRPDARTVRYYVSQDLLPKPISYEGGRARYSGRHVVRLLAIKKLQAEHLTLTKIKSLLTHTSDESILGLAAPRPEPEFEEPVRSPAVEPSTRFHLTGGGSVDLPQRALEDAQSRHEIAEQLLAIARAMREPGGSGGQP